MAVVRVMTWNVQNLFQPGADAGPEGQAAFEAKVASLAAVIDAAGPDVVGLQEIGGQPPLETLQAALANQMPHLELGEPDDRGIRVAFLARQPLTEVVRVRRFPEGLLPVQVGDDPAGPAGPATLNQMGRGALQATVTVDGTAVRLVVCHLKSKLLSFPGGRFNPRDETERACYAGYALYRRTSEAVTLRAHVTGLLDAQPAGPVVVMGDLNDEPDAATTQILQGPPGSEIGTAGYARPDQGDRQRLWNLAPLIPTDRRHSRIYRGRGELIDHIFVSHTALTAGPPEVNTITAEPSGLPSIDDNPNGRRNQPGSDHAAVMATINL